MRGFIYYTVSILLAAVEKPTVLKGLTHTELHDGEREGWGPSDLLPVSR